MGVMHRVGGLCFCVCLGLSIPTDGFDEARRPAEIIGGPLTGAPVLDAPFSADAVTTVDLTFEDGTRLEQTTTARYYRDRAGRVRVEQVLPRSGRGTTAERHIGTIIEPSPGTGVVYTLDDVTRTARSGSRDLIGRGLGGGRSFAVPLGGVRFLVVPTAQELAARGAGRLPDDAVQREMLGSKRIGGVEAIGYRVKLTLPANHAGDNRAVEIVDDQWESPELRVVTFARHSDSRRGVIEYRLANITRADQTDGLFVVPPDYTVDVMPTPRDPWITLIPSESYRAKGWRD